MDTTEESDSWNWKDARLPSIALPAAANFAWMADVQECIEMTISFIDTLNYQTYLPQSSPSFALQGTTVNLLSVVMVLGILDAIQDAPTHWQPRAVFALTFFSPLKAACVTVATRLSDDPSPTLA